MKHGNCVMCQYFESLYILPGRKVQLGIVQLFVRIYKSEQCSDFGGWVGLRKLDVQILTREIIRTPGNPIIIVRRTDFLGHECSD